MNVCIVSHSDSRGGAGKAAYRLLVALRGSGVTAKMLVSHKVTDDDDVIELQVRPNTANFSIVTSKLALPYFYEEYVPDKRTAESNTLFTMSFPGYDISTHEVVRQSDVINVHWASYLLSPRSLAVIDKPIVYTLHDENAYTGGCHYALGCEGYQRDCSACPFLSGDSDGFAAAILNEKVNGYAAKDVAVVSPSQWLADRSRRSVVFGTSEHRVIRNCLDLSIFSPAAIPEHESDKFQVLLGAEYGGEIRKGFSLLEAALGLLPPEAKAQIRLLIFGNDASHIAEDGLEVVALGYLTDEAELASVYRSADVFVIPSTEDNSPNTILEAAACGTPVVCFDVGGVPELVRECDLGHVCAERSAQSLAEGMCSALSGGKVASAQRQRLSKAISQVINEATVAAEYTEYFDAAIERHRTKYAADMVEASETEPRSAEVLKTSYQFVPNSTLMPLLEDINRRRAPTYPMSHRVLRKLRLLGLAKSVKAALVSKKANAKVS